MKTKLSIIVLIFWASNIAAQKFNISFGGFMGINNSYLDSKTSISEFLLTADPAYQRNVSLSTVPKANFGFNSGIFLKVQPIESRLSFETALQIATHNNSYKITVSWEQYYATTGNYWGPVFETERLSNEFSIINIPLIAGYDLIEKDNYRFILFCGLTPNVNTKEGQIRYDQQLNEVTLYKEFYLSYQSGISMNFNKIFCRFKYERSLNIIKANSTGYIPWSSMNVKKLYLNFISLSIGIKLN
jgi:hypothetical protein